jgi:cystathionine beta-lyase family protein involved in aluminum resistance
MLLLKYLHKDRWVYMLKETKDLLMDFYKIDEEIFSLSEEIMKDLNNMFEKIKQVREYNQYKVLKAMQESNLSDIHFNWTTGYGYNDIGREKIEEIYSKVFNTEDAIVRPIIVNGTHALTLCITGLVRPGDEILSVTGKPYDTLEEVIGIRESKGSLKEFGVTYNQVDFLGNGDVDYEGIKNSINNKTKLVLIQRSKGYSWRKSLTIDDIEKIINTIKSVKPEAIVMVDNCYGEFIEAKEPTDVGADIMAGSLIKNPGGGIALTGGYIVGKKELVELISYRLTSPGIGKECGLTFGTSRTVLQGFFLAPYIVSQALMGAIFCARLFEKVGYSVLPKYDDLRSDIIQCIRLNSDKEVIDFCKGIQSAAPVDSFVKPEPWAMPGYDCDVIMAAGAFIQGSSIELSADAPVKPPYNVYFQGGLTFDHSKLGALKALQNIKNLRK